MSNSVVQFYRQKFPNDPRSDDALTLAIGDSQPGKYDGYDDFSKEYRSLKQDQRVASAPGGLLSEFMRSLSYGTDIAESKLYDTAALAGNLIGSERLEKFGEEGRKRNIEEAAPNAPTIGSISDVRSPGEFTRYLAGLIGSQVPQVAGTIAASAAGGALGGVPGAIAAGTAAGFTQIQNRGELVDQGAKHVDATAVGVGLLGGLVQELVPLKITNRFLKGATEDAAKTYIGRVLRAAPVDALAMGGTGLAQEIVTLAGELYANRDNPKFDLTRHEIANRLINAGAAGLMLGGLSGAAEAIPGHKAADEISRDPTLSSYVPKELTEQDKAEVGRLAELDLAGKLSEGQRADIKSRGPEWLTFFTLTKQALEKSRAETKESKAEESRLPSLEPEPTVAPEQATAVQATQVEPEPVEATTAPSPVETVAPPPTAPPPTAPPAEPSPGLPVLHESSQRRRDLLQAALMDMDKNDPVEAAIRSKLAERLKVEKAAAEADPDPSEAQKEAGNYKKGHVTIDGINITIENALGSERSFLGPDGETRSVKMPAEYGYIKRTEGNDGDHVDAYIGPNPASDKVFVIDQVNPETGSFDEHKVMLGFDTPEEATRTYDAGFSDGSGPSRRAAVTPMSKEEFKTYLKNGDQTKPIARGGEKNATEIRNEQSNLQLQREAGDQIGKADEAGGSDRVLEETGKREQAREIADKFTDRIDLRGGITFETGSPFDLDLPDTSKPGNVAMLAKQAVKGARPSDRVKNADKGSSQRGLFLRDNQTGDVILVGVWDNNGIRMTDPDLAVDTPRGADFARVIARRLTDDPGEPRYTPLASVRLNEAPKLLREKFTHEQFDAIQDAALERMTAELSRAPAMQERGFGEHGEVIEGEEGAAETPKDLNREFADVIAEHLPRDSAGKVRGDLTPGDMKEMLLSAFEDPENADVRNFALKEAILDLKDNPKFLALDNLGKQNAILTYVSNKVYEQYRAGGFHDNARAVGALAEGSEGGKLAKDVVPRVEQTSPSVEQNARATENSDSTTRFRRTGESTSGVARNAYDQVIARLQDAGVDVRIFQGKLDGILGKFFGDVGGGLFDRERGLVALVLKDVTAPTHEDLTTAIHEAVHYLFAKETPESRAKIIEAVSRFSDQQLGLDRSTDARISDLNPENLPRPELMEERLAESIALKGLPDPGGVARRIVQFLKDMYVRAAMAVQSAFFGRENVDPELALKYFNSQAQRFLAGGNRMGIIDFLGGPKKRPEQVADLHSPSTGESQIQARWNSEAGRMEYGDVLPDSADAIISNIRNPSSESVFRRPRGVNEEREASPDLSSAVKLPDFAAANHIEGSLRSMYDAWTKAGHNGPPGKPLLSFDDFTSWTLPGRMDKPSDVIRAGNEELKRVGKAPVRTDIRISDLNEFSQKEAASKGLAMLTKIRDALATRRTDAEFETSGKPGSLKARFDRAAQKIIGLTKDYTDADLVLREAKQDLLVRFQEFRDDLKNIKNTAWKTGILSQLVRDIEGRIDVPIARQYVSVMNKLYKRLNDDPVTGRKFVDALEFVAAQKLDWQSMRTSEIRAVLKTAAEDFDALAPLRADSPESRALTAMVAAFAKSNQLMMDTLDLRSQKVAEERKVVNESLKVAMGDSRTAITDAKSMVRKLPRLAATAERILNQLDQEKKLQTKRLDALQREGNFIDFHQDATGALRDGMARVEKIIGAVDVAFEAVDGAEYLVPDGPGAKPEDIEKTRKIFRSTRDAKMTGGLKADLFKMQAWLSSISPNDPMYGSALYNRVKMQIDKIGQNAMDAQQVGIRRNVAIQLLGSIADKLDQTGSPAGKSISRMLRNYTSFIHANRNDANVMGVEWSNAELKARRALGYATERSRIDEFRRRYLDRSLDYISRRTDIRDEAVDHNQAMARAFTELKSHLMHDPESAKEIARPGAWDALEAFLRKHAEVSFRMVETAEKMGLKVKDDATGVNGIFRNVKGAPLFESLRTMSDGLRQVYEHMRDQWINSPLKDEDIATRYKQDPAGLSKQLEAHFTPRVMQDFVGPLARRGGRSAFYAPENRDGTHSLARVEDVKRAFDTSGGDVVKFAENLYDLNGGTTGRAAFIGETIGTLNSFFEQVHSIHQQQSAVQGLNMESVNRLLMDARQSDEWPAEWVRYRTFDQLNTRRMMQQIAYHAAFGRNLAAVETEFQSLIQNLRANDRVLRIEVMPEAQRIASGGGGRALRQAMRQVAEQKGYDLKALESASVNLATVESQRKLFRDYVRSQSGMIMELRPFAELMSTAVGAVVQGPGTAIIDTVSMFKPVTDLGLSVPAVKQIASSFASFGGEIVRSITGIVGKTIKFNSDYVRRREDLGIYDSDRALTIKQKVRAIIEAHPPSASETIGEKVGRTVSTGARIAREVLGFHVGNPAEGATTFKPLGFFTQEAKMMHAATIDGVWKSYEDMVMRAVQFFQNPTNQQSVADPSFHFKSDDLGYNKRIFGLLNDSRAFDYMKARLLDYGMELEQMARDFIRNPNGQLITDDQYRRLAAIGPNEITLETSIVNRPATLLTNPLLSFAVPLVGWSLSQVTATAKSFTGPTGKIDLASFKKGALAFTALTGVSLGYSILRNYYDQEVLGKKSNVLSFGEANPALVILDKTARVGTLGILGDLLNSSINLSTNRDFSIDSRVFAVSSFLAMEQALGTWYHQGEATYATVGRPLLQALGGGGYLQYAQIINNALSLDNAESRVTARINVANYLRSVGRELSLEVRISHGGPSDSVPNSVKPWVSEMSLASYANDFEGFMEAYRKAVDAAKAEGKPDPVGYVKHAFSYQNPLRSVFKTPPTEADYRNILANLTDEGREAVMSAINQINRFGERIGIKEYDGRAERKTGTVRAYDADRLRRSAALSVIGSF